MREPSSFRDNRGFVFHKNNVIYRQVNLAGQGSYDNLMNSGLYEVLTSAGLLVKHVESKVAGGKDSYKVIQPDVVPFISYPYEWSFGQLQDAALATLKIQQIALKHNMTLRDASAYNIQFVGGKPTLIDTLSFEPYQEGDAWQAYRQFCQHFVAPLALMSYINPDLLQLLRIHLDGIPLPLAASMLPLRAKAKPGLLVHLTLHARFQRQHESNTAPVKREVNRTALAGVLDSLERGVRSLKLANVTTEWADYYDNTNYSNAALAEKAALVGEFIAQSKAATVIDLGGNNGFFGRVAAASAGVKQVLSADIDPLAVEDNYRTVKRQKEATLLPLVIDLTNPSPAIGWNNTERSDFSHRASSDLSMALALVHHLAISNNVPLMMVAEYFARFAPFHIIEFIPKEDSQVKRLLATREDIFPEYTQAGFEAAFKTQFEIVRAETLKDSARTLYLMKAKSR